MNTLVVNCYAGPGAGKTTCAWEVASQLKKMGINTEYVSEYAKELVWEKRFDMLEDQELIFEEQSKRLDRLRGKVEVVVTDSPILLSHVYGRDNSKEFTDRIDEEYNSFYNFNLFVEREGKFETAGRIQNLEESKELDEKIKKLLLEKNIYFGKYSHENIKYVAENIAKNLEKIRTLPEKIKTEDRQEISRWKYPKDYDKEELKKIIADNPFELMNVEEQTPEICIEAVSRNFTTLRFVKDKTDEVCYVAIKEHVKSLRYIEHQTPEMFVLAMQQDSSALKYVSQECLEEFAKKIQDRLENGQAVDPYEWELYQSVIIEEETITEEISAEIEM